MLKRLGTATVVTGVGVERVGVGVGVGDGVSEGVSEVASLLAVLDSAVMLVLGLWLVSGSLEPVSRGNSQAPRMARSTRTISAIKGMVQGLRFFFSGVRRSASS